MQFRLYSPPQHLETVLALYRRAIHGLDEGLYDEGQRLAWSGWGNDPRRAAALLAQGVTLLACKEGQVLGFAQLLPVDCINMLYVDPAHGRQGVASALVSQLEGRALEAQVATLHTRASRASQPLFLRMGYSPGQEEWVMANGTSLPRRRMIKALSPGA
ncbi:MAG: GNAT family N-acetyltransferase [Oleiphilaceae bacterium]|nr:GNAT family N-acetyltransferase [Oleiphilaceae bacterium]